MRHLPPPIRETRLIPDEVKANPDAYREIDRASIDRFDYQRAVIFIERIIRPIFVARGNLDAAPIKSPAPPSLGLGATPRLVACVLAAANPTKDPAAAPRAQARHLIKPGA